MKILIVILILFFIVVIMFHFFGKTEGFWSINSNSRKRIPQNLENYKMITVPNSSVYKEDVPLFGLACADRLVSSDVYNTMVITNDDSDSSKPYSCYVGNYTESAVSTPMPVSTRPPITITSKKRPPILIPRGKKRSPAPQTAPFATTTSLPVTTTTSSPVTTTAPPSLATTAPPAPITIDNNKYSSAACLSSKTEGKKLTDTPLTLILGDLITENGSNYRITEIVDKSNPAYITGVFNTYSFQKNAFELSLADAAETEKRFDTKPDDKVILDNILRLTPGNVNFKPDNMISSVVGWIPSGYFLRVTKAEDAIPLRTVDVAGNIGAKSLLNFNGEVKYAPTFGYMIKDLKNWVSSGKKPCDLYSDPPGNYNAYELAKYTYNKADPDAQVQIDSYPALEFLSDTKIDVPSEAVLQEIYDGLPDGAK